MPVKCRKCGEEHDDWVPKDRLEGKNELIKDLQSKQKELEAQVKELDGAKGAVAELARLKGELAERDAMAAAGFSGDAKALKRAKALYGVATEDEDEAKRPTFADWLADEKGGKAEPGLAAHFKAAEGAKGGTPVPPTTPAKPPTTPTQARPPAPPQVDKGARTGDAPQPKRTAEDVRAIIASPAFSRLSPADQKARLAELEAEVATEGA